MSEPFFAECAKIYRKKGLEPRPVKPGSKACMSLHRNDPPEANYFPVLTRVYGANNLKAEPYIKMPRTLVAFSQRNCTIVANVVPQSGS